MRGCGFITGGFVVLAAAFGSIPSQAKTLTFDASLDGRYGAEPTGSNATGVARIAVDTKRRTVSVDLTVSGIAADDLWDKLVAAPIGPVHLHKYATSEGGESVLVVPIPYGAAYEATTTGMRVTMKNYDYAAGAALLKSNLSFDDFVTAMKGGLIVLNIHTDAFNAGEISGRVGNHGPTLPVAKHDH